MLLLIRRFGSLAGRSWGQWFHFLLEERGHQSGGGSGGREEAQEEEEVGALNASSSHVHLRESCERRTKLYSNLLENYRMLWPKSWLQPSLSLGPAGNTVDCGDGQAAHGFKKCVQKVDCFWNRYYCFPCSEPWRIALWWWDQFPVTHCFVFWEKIS